MVRSLSRLILPVLLATASCAVEVGPPVHEVVLESGSPGEPIYVNESPPPPREDVIVGLSPGPGYVWVGGYWSHRPTGWVWITGRWVTRPRPGVTWAPGHWEHTPRGHGWVSGHWR